MSATARCWDCATGNGQAALALAEHFDHVIATDASRQQLAEARQHPRVEYRCERAEATTIESTSIDLITIAAALHWLDREAFYREVRRVAKPGALIAAWTYSVNLTVSPAVDAVIADFTGQLLKPFWAHQLNHVLSGYQNIEFPFEPVAFPSISINGLWTLDQLLGKLGTWSAAARYTEHHGHPATEVIRERLTEAWLRDGPASLPREMSMPLYFRVGRVFPTP